MANVCKTYGNVVSTSEWTFALWDLNDIVYSRSCVFCATCCFGQGSWCSLSKRLQHKKKQKHGLSWDFFARPAPPPRDWLKGMTGRFWRPPKPWKTYCYWEHISHINVSQPLSPDRTMHNKCDTSIQIAVCFSIFPAGLAWFGQTLLLGISKFWPPPPPASFLASSSRDFAASPCLRRIRGMPRCKGLKPRPTQNCRVWNSLKLVIWLNMIEPLTYSWNMKSVVSS